MGAAKNSPPTLYVQNVKVYNAENAVFEADDFSMTELPPVSEEVKNILLEAGGTCDDKPNVRIVSGLDETLQEWYGGRYWRKYGFRLHNKKEYHVLHEPNGNKRILSPAELRVIANSKKISGIILPVVENNVVEYGLPRYIVEFYKPPELFGREEEWEKVRWFQDEAGVNIDLMGPWPSEGMYETWFIVEEAIENELGEIVSTKFREIDDVVLELILAKIEEAKKFSASEQHTNLRNYVNSEYWRKVAESKSSVKDIVSERVDRLVN